MVLPELMPTNHLNYHWNERGYSRSWKVILIRSLDGASYPLVDVYALKCITLRTVIDSSAAVR